MQARRVRVGCRQVSVQYTLANTLVTSFPNSERQSFGEPQGPPSEGNWVADVVQRALNGERPLGASVTAHRTSWVERLATATGEYYVKVYDYGSWGDSLRQLWRRPASVLGGRAAREFAALAWLRQHGFAAPEPLAHAATRRLGLIQRAVLVTRAWNGTPLDQCANQPPAALAALAKALAEFVGSLHELGFRDRNLDPRNLLVRCTDGHWQIAKLDSPRFLLRPKGPATDRLAAADWQRLLAQLPEPLAAATDAARQRRATAN